MYGLMTRVLLALKHSGGREQSDFARNYECNSYIPKSFPSQGFLQEQSSCVWGRRFKKLSDLLLKPTVCVSVSGSTIYHNYSTETNEVRLLAVLSTKTISQILFDGAGKQLGVLGHKACHLPRLIAISLEISAGGWEVWILWMSEGGPAYKIWKTDRYTINPANFLQVYTKSASCFQGATTLSHALGGKQLCVLGDSARKKLHDRHIV